MELRDHLRQHLPLADRVELIVESPMRRTLQTAMVGLEWLVERGVEVRLDADWQGKCFCSFAVPLLSHIVFGCSGSFVSRRVSF